MLADLRFAARALRRSPAFTTTAVATIALAMVLASTTFAVVDGVLFKPLPYPDADRLFFLYGARNTRGAQHLSFRPVDMRHWRAVPGVRFAMFDRLGELAGIGDFNRPIVAATIDRDFFDVLGQRPMVGGFRAEDFDAGPTAPRGVLITHRLWRLAFGGDRSVIGQPIVTPLPFPLHVAGVLPPDFLFPVYNGRELPDVLLPADMSSDLRGMNSFRGLARLDPGVQPDAVRQALSSITQSHRRADRTPDGQPAIFDGVAFESVANTLGRHERGEFRLALAAALGLVVLACVNVAGLVAARGRERVRDLSLRVALGARRHDLLRLLLAESALLGLAGGAIGAALAWPALASVSALLPTSLVYLKAPAIDSRVVIFALSAATLSVLVMTFPAAVTSMRAGLRDRLAAAGAGATERARTSGRRVLVAAQTAIGLVLVLGGTLLLASFVKLAREDHGFDLDRTARLLVFSPRLAEMLAEIRRAPGVMAVAATDAQILQRSFGSWGYQFPKGLGIGENSARVTAEYFDIAGVQLIEGRLPTPAEIETKPPVMVVSDALAQRAWPGQSAVGRIVSQSPMMVTQLGDATIVGVVSDVRLQSLDEREAGEVYLPLTEPNRMARFTILLRTAGDPSLAAADVARRLRAWDSRVSVLAAESLRASVWGSVRSRIFDSVLYGSLGASALVLVAVGVAGLVATGVARRRREIGVRMALGADRRAVRVLVVGETMRPVVVGLIVGAVASYWTAALVKASLYGTSPHDPWAWGATIVTILAAALVASWLPARRASRIDPVIVLRTE
jgi:predicted permease